VETLSNPKTIHSGLTSLLRPTEKSEMFFDENSENEKSNSNLKELSEQQETKLLQSTETEVKQVPENCDKVPNKNEQQDDLKGNQPIRSRVNTLDLTGYKVKTSSKDNSYSTFQTGSGKISSALGNNQFRVNSS
jgi:hypothetical protein